MKTLESNKTKNGNRNLKAVGYELTVDVTPEKAWEVLTMFGNIGEYHTEITKSRPLNGSSLEASLGTERECTIGEGKNPILLSERIIKYKELDYFQYKAFDAKGFPATDFYNTFGIKRDNEGMTVIFVKTDFRLKPAILTHLMAGKLRKNDRLVLLSYKHFMETGEKKTDVKTLKRKYKDF